MAAETTQRRSCLPHSLAGVSARSIGFVGSLPQDRFSLHFGTLRRAPRRLRARFNLVLPRSHASRTELARSGQLSSLCGRRAVRAAGVPEPVQRCGSTLAAARKQSRTKRCSSLLKRLTGMKLLSTLLHRRAAKERGALSSSAAVWAMAGGEGFMSKDGKSCGRAKQRRESSILQRTRLPRTRCEREAGPPVVGQGSGGLSQ